MSALKVKLFSIQHASSDLEYIGLYSCQEEESYKGLRLCLESVGCVEWPFEFWDLEELCRINKKLEGLNTIGKCVYVIPISSPEDRGTTKWRCIVAFGTIEENEDLATTMEESEDQVGDDAIFGDLILPTDSSRVSGNTELGSMNDLKLTLLPKEVLDKYFTSISKLRRELALIDLEDHSWHLKSWNLNDVAVVKLFCGECNKDFGGNNGDHLKSAIHNLFSNFKKSYI
jgi:hypothetical protein